MPRRKELNVSCFVENHLHCSLIIETFSPSYLMTNQVIGVLFNCCEPESITKVLKEIQLNPQIHSHLHHPPKIPYLTQTLKTKIATPVYLGAYANRLTPIDPKWSIESSDDAQAMRKDLSPGQYWEGHVRLWHNHHTGVETDDACGAAESESHVHTGDLGEIGGVQLIGGCCAIGPGHISVLKERLNEN